jgi:hypothetical protein
MHRERRVGGMPNPYMRVVDAPACANPHPTAGFGEVLNLRQRE